MGTEDTRRTQVASKVCTETKRKVMTCQRTVVGLHELKVRDQCVLTAQHPQHTSPV